MQVEYDLVIVGGSYLARYGAGLASQQGARVALVEPPGIHMQPFSLEAIEPINQRPAQGSQPLQTSPAFTPDLVTLLENCRKFAELLPEELSLRGLSSLGVDVIVGGGNFNDGNQGLDGRKIPQNLVSG
ncbi:MAG: hypothetical protein HC916_06535 [Coleofasciculaceae cyanobacterium SM2_1_6]|nr:hypothetical protein [Coleofasciculaceae cyanobacterium SM2_1_6]